MIKIKEALEELKKLNEDNVTKYVVWYHEKFHKEITNYRGGENTWKDVEQDFVITVWPSEIGKGRFGDVPDFELGGRGEVRGVYSGENLEEVARKWGWKYSSKEEAEAVAKDCQDKFGHIEPQHVNRGQVKDREFHVLPLEVEVKEPEYKSYEDEARDWYNEPHADYGD